MTLTLKLKEVNLSYGRELSPTQYEPIESLDYNAIDKSDISNLPKCLMVKNNLK